jgi:thiamine-monophosphate kinase
VKVSELGEFGLIERLEAVLTAESAGVPPERLLVGIGDDAAVWRNNGNATVATTDTMVADVHFLPGKTPWRDVGWKSIAVNVSDVAAMGCWPNYALITLGLPADMEGNDIEELYVGIAEACNEYGVTVTGGDVVRAPVTFITVALTGRAEMDADGEPRLLLRSAAQAGEAIAVTGSLGGAAAGLRVLLRGAENDAENGLIARHQRPQARVEAGTAAVDAGIRCGIDVSDGLLRDLGHVCKQSDLGALLQVDDLPIDPALSATFGTAESIALAAGGGEDYELLLVGERSALERLRDQLDLPLTLIGEMTPDAERKVRLVTGTGEGIELSSEGWDHLA